MQKIDRVSWQTYAGKYDLLFEYNPFYQELHRQVMAEVERWDIAAGDLLADIGAGTGNYSLPMAQAFPQARVLHIDQDAGMNLRAREKRDRLGLANLEVIDRSVDELELADHSLRAMISVHALYTFPEPGKVLRAMYRWLQPGGEAVLVNAGRIVKVLDWQLAIGRRLLRRYGLVKTLEIMKEGREVSRQNAFIRNMQRQGIYWTHSHEEFCRAVQRAGFELLHSQTCFRGVSDLVLVRKCTGG